MKRLKLIPESSFYPGMSKPRDSTCRNTMSFRKLALDFGSLETRAWRLTTYGMKSAALLLPIFIFTAGCKVGPDYEVPKTSMPESFLETQKKETFVPSDEQLVGWWQQFEDPFLNSLLEEAVSGNFDYRIALEQMEQARSQYWVQFTQILPEIEFDAQGSRFRTSQSFANASPSSRSNTTTSSTTSSPITPPFPTNGTPATPTQSTTTTTSSSSSGVKISPVQSFFQIGFDAIWEIDLWGQFRRAADAAYDTFEAASETSRDVKISILSEVANTYAAICSFQEKVALQTRIVESDEIAFTSASDRFSSGINPEQDVASALAALETDRASLKSLQTGLKSRMYSLAVLLGKKPEVVVQDFLIVRPIPQVNGKIPAGFPADLLKRRHDIRSAERQLAAATEEVGVAVAQLYPSLSLTGSSSSFAANPLQGANAGFSSDKLHKLFKHKSRIWGIGGLLTMPVFDFGKRLAGIDVQLALQRQASLAYEKTVIAALEEVETALAAYFDQEESAKSLGMMAAANKRNYDLTFGLFKAGLADASQVAAAKDIWLSAERSYTDSKQALTSDFIAVYKSLGGDW
jgi:NodT family efflux transporter outer membrane factor (OMF) lipoprotein